MEQEQNLSFQDSLTFWASSSLWDSSIPKEPTSPLFMVRDFLKAIRETESCSS